MGAGSGASFARMLRSGRRGGGRPPARPRRLCRHTRAARGGAASGRPVHLLRSHGARGICPWTGDRCAAASAYRPRDRNLPVRRRDRAPRQPRIAPGHSPRRRQLDDRRTRRRALGTNRRRAATCRLARTRAAAVGRAAAGARGNRPRVPPLSRGDAPLLNLAGTRIRVLAGHAYGQVSPVAMLSPLFYADVALPAGSELPLPREHRNAPPMSSIARSAAVRSAASAAACWSLRQGPRWCCAR